MNLQLSVRPHLLIVDDDSRLRELLCKFLSENGFFVTPAADTIEAKQQLSYFVFDLMILDIMMQGVNGLDFLKELRKTNKLPVLLLSAKWEVGDRLLGFEVGADDYLPKPFDPRELLWRIQSILRRAETSPRKEAIKMGACTFYPQRNLLLREGVTLSLSTSELSLLKALAENLGETLSREQLISLCEVPISPRSIDVQITRLRKKLEENPAHPQYLKTARNLGYVLWAELI